MAEAPLCLLRADAGWTEAAVTRRGGGQGQAGGGPLPEDQGDTLPLLPQMHLARGGQDGPSRSPSSVSQRRRQLYRHPRVVCGPDASDPHASP